MAPMHSPWWPACSMPTAIAPASAARASNIWPVSTWPATATTLPIDVSTDFQGLHRRASAAMAPRRMHRPGPDRSARHTSWRPPSAVAPGARPARWSASSAPAGEACASSSWPAPTSPATATTSTWSTSVPLPGSTSPCRRRDGARARRVCVCGPAQGRSAARTVGRHLQVL